MGYLLLFLSGALLCNSLPHLISGLRGETFYTPWATPRGIGQSSALENFLWGVANLLAGAVLAYRNLDPADVYALVALAAGFVVAGSWLSVTFGTRRSNS